MGAGPGRRASSPGRARTVPGISAPAVDARRSWRRSASSTEDIPALWHAPTTTARDRQAIARLLLERVVVTVAGDQRAGRGDLPLGRGRAHRPCLTRPVKRLVQLSTYAALLERIGDLHAAGLSAPAIAAALNREGWRPPKRRADVHRRHGAPAARGSRCSAQGPACAIPRHRTASGHGIDAPGTGGAPGDALPVGLSLASARLAASAPRGDGQRRPIWLVMADADETQALAGAPPGEPIGPTVLPATTART